MKKVASFIAPLAEERLRQNNEGGSLEGPVSNPWQSSTICVRFC